jgi:superfamily II DNA/RNA helicase
MLRVPAVPAHKLQGLTAQVKARAVVYGNGVEASEHPKFQAAAAAAIALADSGRGTLICAENRAGVQQLREMLRAGLEARQGKCFLLSGDTPDSEREGALAEMRTLCASGRPVVVIATPQVAAAGLNMQDLSAVLLVGLFWTMQDLRQTVARAHRIGQKRGCLCVALVTGREDQAQLDIMQRKTRSTAAYYGDQSAHMLRDDHIERLGVCEVGGVAGAVGQMLARLDEGKPGPEHAQGAAPWPLFCRSSETFE